MGIFVFELIVLDICLLVLVFLWKLCFGEKIVIILKLFFNNIFSKCLFFIILVWLENIVICLFFRIGKYVLVCLVFIIILFFCVWVKRVLYNKMIMSRIFFIKIVLGGSFCCSKDIFYFNIKNNYLEIFYIIIDNL